MYNYAVRVDIGLQDFIQFTIVCQHYIRSYEKHCYINVWYYINSRGLNYGLMLLLDVCSNYRADRLRLFSLR